jgi:hypothetical protein
MRGPAVPAENVGGCRHTHAMTVWSFADVERAVRASWGADTCDPAAVDEWRPDNPAKGQCGVTAFVVQDLFGGQLILGEVQVEGTKTENHYWNRFSFGVELDLTREQFGPEQVVVGGRVVERPPDAPRRCREQYELLRSRVIARLPVS